MTTMANGNSQLQNVELMHCLQKKWS